MEPKILNINNEDFIIHFKDEGLPSYKTNWSGTATEIQVFSDGTWMYQSNHSSDFVNELKDARVWFEWSFRWRGVWEGRIYFKDEEYWSEEMETIPLLWKQIKVLVKKKIKSDNPGMRFDD